ncbi:alpha/beta fold hydrolase [Massilia sp. Root351]|jgi:pimeloyl-ACP methyl ester carboxylesterase|uniref:alpha/beta fold hydrolase n=1 Tax=Massilia sp. Root351 TaxID=1736522 RepID=UPI0009EA61D8|nr:alpha/beta hydrolase [Massilia sp. Root351]
MNFAGISAMAPEADGLQYALSLLERHFAERTVAVEGGMVSYREIAAAPGAPGVPPAPAAQSATQSTVVLLHGIGSGAASWLPCALELAAAAPGSRVIAWNAPGYGSSSVLAAARPGAEAYAARLRQMLQALGVLDSGRFVLVGHSLGAMMACAYAAAHPATLDKLVLLSPARGYGQAARLAQGAQVARERLSTVGELGVHGMATQRSSRLLSGNAGTTQRDWVRWNMAQLNLPGYTQAVHLLCGDAIDNYALSGAVCAVASVHCGSADNVTTPADCRLVAEHHGLPFALIDQAGHACYVEQPQAAAAAILN